MIEITNLKIKFDNLDIIKDVNMKINSGDFVTIYGKNGSGKSTIIKAIAQINKYDGAILYNSRDVKKIPKKERAQIFSFLMQSGNDNLDMTVREYIKFGRTPYHNFLSNETAKDVKLVDDTIKMLELEEYENRIVNSLSGGEKQRVFLAMCLVQEPEVLVLDEITNHLDIKHQVDLLTLVHKICKEKGITVITILHDINFSLKFADHIFFLDQGVIKFIQDTKQKVNKDIVEEIFDMKVELIKHNEKEFVHYF